MKSYTDISANAARSFVSSDVRKIYAFPPPTGASVAVGVIALGGQLTGNVDPTTGILTGGDVQAYWTSIGIAAANQPVVKVVYVNGTQFDPSDSGSTMENTIDVEMIGACCPTSKLTIVLYFSNQYKSPPRRDAFYDAFNEAINGPIKLNALSCSWGAGESQFAASDLTKYNTLFASAVAKGITITAAAGDTGSNNGFSVPTADFPCSSPNVVACGGTSLVCPNFTYDASTRETTWAWNGSTGTGGGVSNFFQGPPFPTPSGTLARQVPDVALVADPSTGVSFLVQGANMVIGGTSIVAPAIAGLAACLPQSTPPRSMLTRLYALPTTAFRDITTGSNGAYSAGAGYDRCTGLGSINGASFANSYASLVARPVTSISSLPATVTVPITTPTQLIASAAATTATNKTLAWTSSNTAVATVSQTGLVTGKAAGSSVITATTVDGFYTTSATAKVTLPIAPVPAPIPAPPPPPAIKSIALSLNPGGRTISSGSAFRGSAFNLFVTPSTAVTWSSSNTSLATVSGGFVQMMKQRGTCIITARVNGGPSASMNVTII